ncbi:MAG: phage tail sheath C-terminal domain-containing protein, partial [Kofleriaceae bacterium]
ASGHFNLGVTRYASETSSTVVATERFATLDKNDFVQSVNDTAQSVRLTVDSDSQPAVNGTLGNKKVPLVANEASGLHDKKFKANTRTATLKVPAGADDAHLTLVNVRAMVEMAIREAGATGTTDPTLVGATVTVVGGRLWIRTDPRTPNYDPTKRITIATDTLDLNAIGMDAAYANVQEYVLDGGGDGVAADPTAIKGDESAKTGLFALENADLFNILCLPITAELDEAPAKAVMDAALAYCVRRRAMYIVDIRESVTTPPAVQDWVDANATQIVSPNAAVYFPRVLLPDPKDNYRPRPMPNSGTIAGIWAKTDTERGVWKAPAGIDAILRGVAGFEYLMSDGENGVLNPLGIDCLRTFPVYGQIVWGARTLYGAESRASEWKYIPIRRLALMIEESLFRGTKWVVFEPNDEPLWAKIRQNVGAFMTTLFRQGAFQGGTPDRAYFVKCDGETTTAADRNLGVVNIEVGFAPLKPAEFVVLKIQQIPDLV